MSGCRGDDDATGPTPTTPCAVADGVPPAAGAPVHSTTLPSSLRGATKQRVYSSRPLDVVGAAPGRYAVVVTDDVVGAEQPR